MFEYFFALTLIFLVLSLILYRKLQKEVSSLRFDKQSITTRFGKTAEQFMPFLNNYPYSKESFRFLGTPIDGVQFEDTGIVFVEFKTGNSRLSAKQERIKELVENGKVEFKEMRI
ncbi:MAG: endonuclease [Candidatus Aenigmarchaeota archaeon]|nr:endonuclease [Candidatus Aenigmarchaeota archaeon]